MKEYIRMFNKRVNRTSLIFKTVSFIAKTGPVVGPILEPKKFDTNLVEISIANLPAGLENLKLLHLSDLHASAYIRKPYLKKVVEIANSFDPDIVFITGDFTEIEYDDILWSSKILADLKNKFGIWGVLGNHDVCNGEDDITQCLGTYGINILRNENKCLTINNESLYIAGIDDYKFGKSDIDKAMENIPSDNVVIFLSHNPDAIEKLNGYKVDLQLSGHIHGGQWNLPFVGVLYIPSKLGKKHAWGLSKDNDTYIYTSRGIGSTTIPFRINCPPEIALLTLKNKA